MRETGQRLSDTEKLNQIGSNLHEAIRAGKRVSTDEWGFPDNTRDRIPTYEWLPKGAAPLLIAVKEGQPKWYTFVIPKPAQSQLLTPLFEFNIHKQPGGRVNFRFFDRPDGVEARCYGLFTTRGRKPKPASAFFSFLEERHPDVPARLDERNRPYFEFYRFAHDGKLSLNNFLLSLARLCRILAEYKHREGELPAPLRTFAGYAPESQANVSYQRPSGTVSYEKRHGKIVEEAHEWFKKLGYEVSNDLRSYDLFVRERKTGGKSLLIEVKLLDESNWQRELYSGIGQLSCYDAWLESPANYRALLTEKLPSEAASGLIQKALTHAGITLLQLKGAGAVLKLNDVDTKPFF